MARNQYDAIVVGARCAGSPTAMLLARKGYKVLVVDRARFPSDTVSTHLLHPPGVAALARWGLLEPLVASGCPPIDTYAFDLGPFTLSGAPGTAEAPVAYAPRRTVLDKLLVDAAAQAGAEIREGFTVESVVVDDRGVVTGIRGHGGDGRSVTERAKVVVGADGRHSLVARAVGPEHYHQQPRLQVSYYSYWSGLPMEGRFQTYLRPGRGFAAWPTHDDLTLVIGGWPYAEHQANRVDVEGNVLTMLELAPAFADRVAAATRQGRLVGTAVANFFRKPYGPGWALVGDAGYNKDFITAQGMHDAFRDAEGCATALEEAFAGARSLDDAMAAYQSTRDAQVLPMYELTTQLATLQPHHPSWRGCWGPSTATSRPWTPSPRSSPACCPPPTSSPRSTWTACSPPPGRPWWRGDSRAWCCALVASISWSRVDRARGRRPVNG
jgi:2-polyprenyl-6-methoxyphenol hydroxylase-like FAD-dependent oxidoreductase